MPGFVAGSSSMMPEWSALIVSSRAEQSMPKLSTPRSLPFLIFSGLPFLSRNSGMAAPIFANAVLIPLRMFGAPHTT